MIPSEGDIDRLIAQAQTGDQDALSQLCARYRPFLQTIAALKLGRGMERRVDASDIVQETEIELVRGIHAFRGKSEPELSAWLKQMLKRNIADKVRDNIQERILARRFILTPAASRISHRPLLSTTSPLSSKRTLRSANRCWPPGPTCVLSTGFQ